MTSDLTGGKFSVHRGCHARVAIVRRTHAASDAEDDAHVRRERDVMTFAPAAPEQPRRMGNVARFCTARPQRNPAASSSSKPGVRIVTLTA